MWQPLNGEPPLPSWGISPQPDEPAHRFFARLTALNGQDSARSMAHQMGLNGRSGAGLLEFCLAMPIREKERLQASTAQIDGSRVTLCGQTFSKKDWSIRAARVCPKCLHESRYARNWWDIRFMFRCPFHDEPLINEAEGSVTRWWTADPSKFTDGTLVWKCDVAAGSAVTSPNWEAYVLGRMNMGPRIRVASLDDIDSLGETVKAVEYVGRASVGGYAEKRPSEELKGAAREKIVRVGFAALLQGYPALRCIAKSIAETSPHQRTDLKGWGTRGLFGWVSRAYNTDLPDVPEFERALWDEAVARAMYPQSHKRPVVRDDNLPLTMVDLAQELSLSVKTTHKLACELGFADATSNRSRRHVLTRDVVEKIKQVKSRLVDRDRATSLMGIERRCFDALVYNGDIVSIIRYKVGEVTSDRFDSQKIADYVADQCKRLGKNWFNHISKQPQPPKSQSTSSARFRRLPQADGLGINEAASIIRVDRVTALSMVDAGILVALGGVTKSVRLTAESVERARWAYAPAQLYASCLADACDPGVAGKALASKGVPSVPLGPGAKAVVERAAARKALGLSADPDRVEGSLPCLWGVIEEAVRSAGLPFVSTQLPLGSTLILADSSRLARLAFTVVDGESTLVGATASGINFSRRNAILPHIAGNLRKGQQRSSAEFTLDESGTQATLNEFHVRDFASWHRATHFVTEYLTYVRHGLYEARAQLREVGR